MSSQIRMGVLGAGRITPFHLECARSLGFTISAICGRQNSSNAKRLAQEFRIPFLVDNAQKMLEIDVDCYLVTSSTNAQVELLKLLIPTNRFILVEKPVATNDGQFKSIIDHFYVERVVVGYNRRFYSSVQDLKKIIDVTEPLNFMLNLPESSWNPNPTASEVEYLLVENAVHMFDLLFFLFGKPSEVKFCGSGQLDELFSRWILLNYEKRNVCGAINLSFGVPDNYSLSVTSRGTRWQLLPIETLTSFDGIKVNPATLGSPNKSYSPVTSTNWTSKPQDISFKAGFYEQMYEFKTFIESGTRTERQATLEEAREAVCFARSLLPL